MRLGLQNAELKAALIADTLRKEKAILEDYKRLKPAVDEARQKLASLMETFDRAIELKGERDAKIEEYCRAVADQGKWGAFSPADFVEATHLPELKEVRPKVEATLRRVIVTKAEEALAKFIEKNREVLIRWKALE